MSQNFTLFETSWEVANKVGGIYTVISTKAKTLVERFGDDYVTIGPWLLSDAENELPFEDEPGFEAFCESCREVGVPVRVGRWRIPGRPRAILVEFSGLYDEKDDLLAELWEDFQVDSLHGGWDYAEPVLFGLAAARVIERWWEEFLAPRHQRAVAQFHEWMTGSGLLALKRRTPAIGTVFTTHATMLGRALSSLGISPDDGLGDRTARELAAEHGVVAKHSIEGVCAREADVFTTVSEITAREAALLHDRRPEPVLPNGIDLDVIDSLAGPVSRDETRTRLFDVASRFVGEDVSDALLLATSGRYEFHNKGIDVLLESLAMLSREGRRVCLFVLVPAGNSGLRGEVAERLERPLREVLAERAPLGLSTHNLFDAERDPVHESAARLGLANQPGSRVKLIQIPIYLSERDDFLGLPYEAVLRAMDLTCFPSFYEPWGYTPQESLALGVPTITTDYAGFGRWALGEALRVEHGIEVLPRVHVEYEKVVERLAGTLSAWLAEGTQVPAEECRKTAQRTAWSDLVTHHEEAFQLALASVAERLEKGVPLRRRPRRAVPVRPSGEKTVPRLESFDVSATLPEKLRGLERLANNYYWCWDPEGKSLFRELSPRCWDAVGHNPVAFLRQVFLEDLEEKAADRTWLAKLKRVLGRLDAYLAEPERDWSKEGPASGATISRENPVAYFSAEFGIHESLRIYSGGLGVLAGDHLKSASDLNLPLVGVGLFYRMGYMTQRLDSHGEQIAVETENVSRDLPLEPVLDADGARLEVVVQLPGRSLYLRAWRAAVGRVTLYLLDADTPSNREEDREITRMLYGGDHEMRLRQEICLGRGGARLLAKLDISPSVFHINEGHAAFLTLERVSFHVRKLGLTFEAACELVRSSTVFTTHTPVPAGHDRFGEDLMRRYFSDVPEWVGLPWERFLQLGRAGDEESFNMTYLACSFASRVNGVSKLHGIASRELLHAFWPASLESEVPVGSITNGIHLPTWTDPELCRALGAGERIVNGEDFAAARKVLGKPALWKIRQAARQRLLDALRTSLKKSFLERHDSPALLDEMLDGLDEDALYIGFARRFAPYKRAHLAFSDPERLRAILSDPERPVRLLVAGKAHPADQLGKDILKGIAEIARSEEFAGRVLFLENYDMDLATALVQGVDVWLNNPTRMLEASGTSGMKAAANGALNLSIADGWWDEAFDGRNGWRIAGPRVYDDQALQDEFDAAALYRLLEEEVVPLYFQRDAKGVPTGWLDRVLHDLETIPQVFDTDRMVLEYARTAYLELGANCLALRAALRTRPDGLAREHARLRKGFEQLSVVEAQIADLRDVQVGDTIDARMRVDLAGLSPEDVVCELVLGHSKNGDDLIEPRCVVLEPVAGEPGLFAGACTMRRSGSYAYGLRVRARSQDDPGDSLRHLIRWA